MLTIHRTGVKVACSVKHRNGASFGVQFETVAGKTDHDIQAKPTLLAYEQLLALATAERESDEFDARYGHALKPRSRSVNPRSRHPEEARP